MKYKIPSVETVAVVINCDTAQLEAVRAVKNVTILYILVHPNVSTYSRYQIGNLTYL